MALTAPTTKDSSEYIFKLHHKTTLFSSKSNGNTRTVDLLAAASNYGLIFAGNSESPELKVIILQSLIDAKGKNGEILVRSYPLPGLAHNIAVSCDSRLLAVNYTQNGTALIAIYDVPSFYAQQVIPRKSIRIAAEDNVYAKQILWNPVTAETFAVVSSNGSLSSYTIQDSLLMFNVDKQEQVQCACWSPKGKQIVAGFPNGKLVQFKPDLKVAKTIPCPPNIHNAPFSTIAIQWLSTYQFAVVFRTDRGDASLNLYIVNAPKTSTPTYINYFDVCSSTGPRNSQAWLHYIQSWNLLLVASANSMETGLLGTEENTEFPVWKEYIAPDGARMALPLLPDKQESFPIGMALNFGTTHQLVIEENEVSVMPMAHFLSTHGEFLSFDFINFAKNAPSICSPPQPLGDTSGLPLFAPLSAPAKNLSNNTADVQQPQAQQQLRSSSSSEISFVPPSGATSTPANNRKQNTVLPLFGSQNSSSFTVPQNQQQENKPQTLAFGQPPAIIKPVATQATSGGIFGGGGGNIFGTSTGASAAASNLSQSTFGGMTGFGQTTGFSFGNTTNQKPTEGLLPKPKDQAASIVTTTQEKSKPLYTVPPAYSAPLTVSKIGVSNVKYATTAPRPPYFDESSLIIREFINSFTNEIQDLSIQSTNLHADIGDINKSKETIRKLNSPQEVTEQAEESTDSLTTDIKGLRNSLNETFGMITEVKSKLNMYKNPELPNVSSLGITINQTNRRQLTKLKNLLAVNEKLLHLAKQQIDSQWSNHQDSVRQNSKHSMRVPSLEAIYQTLNKEKDILAAQRQKINYFKMKLGVRGNVNNFEIPSVKPTRLEMDSLNDSILSMSLYDRVKDETSKLTPEKLKAIKDALSNHKVISIIPQRPNREDLRSEVISEIRKKADTLKQLKQNKHEIENMKVYASSVENSTKSSSQTQEVEQISFLQPKPIVAHGEKPDQKFVGLKQPVTVSNQKQENFTVAMKPSEKTSLINEQPKTFQPVQINAANASIETSKKLPLPGFSMKSNVQPQATVLSYGLKDKTTPSGQAATVNLFKTPITTAENKFDYFGDGSKNVTNSSSFAAPSTATPVSGGFQLNLTTKKYDSESKAATSTSAASKYSFPSSSTSGGFQLNLGKQDAEVTVPSSITITPTTMENKTPASQVSSYTFKLPKQRTTLPGTANDNEKIEAELNIKSFLENLNVCEPTTSIANAEAGTNKTSDNMNNSSNFSISSAANTPETKPFSFLPATTTAAAATSFGVVNLSTSTANIATAPVKSIFGGTVGSGPTSFSFGATTQPTKSEVVTEPTSTSSSQPLTTTSSLVVIPSTASSISFGESVSTALAQTSASDNKATTATSPFNQTVVPASTSAPPTFGQSTTGLFAGFAKTTPNTFGTNSSPSTTGTSSFTASSGQGLFAAASFGSQAPSTGSIFSGSAAPPFAGGTLIFSTSTEAAPPANTFASPNQSAVNIAATTANIFGSPTQTPVVSSTGNTFFSPNAGSTAGGGAFFSGTPSFGNAGQTTGVSSGSIFGGGGQTVFGGGVAAIQQPTFGSVAANTTSPESSPFGGSQQQSSPSSIFGGAGAAASAQSAMFGGGAFGQQRTGSAFGAPVAQNQSVFGGGGFGQASSPSVFGGQPAFGGTLTTAFGATSPGGGAFSQTGASIAESGFGTSPFGKPTPFGAAAQSGFGSSPTFGSTPVFGATSFGSPKSSFGSFNVPNNNTSGFGAPTQKSNLFEALGSTDTGLSFGNLAQNSNTQPPKAPFQGQMFSGWR